MIEVGAQHPIDGAMLVPIVPGQHRLLAEANALEKPYRALVIVRGLCPQLERVQLAERNRQHVADDLGPEGNRRYSDHGYFGGSVTRFPIMDYSAADQRATAINHADAGKVLAEVGPLQRRALGDESCHVGIVPQQQAHQVHAIRRGRPSGRAR